MVVRIQTDEGISGVGDVALAYGVGSDAGIGVVRNLAEAAISRYLCIEIK